MSSTRKSTRRKPSTTSRYLTGGEKNTKPLRITKPTFVEVGPKFGGGRGKRQTYIRPGEEDEEDGLPAGTRANSQFSSAYAIRSPPHSPLRVTSISTGSAISMESPQSDDPLSNLNAPTVAKTRSARRTLTSKSVPGPTTNTNKTGSTGHFFTPNSSADKQKKRRLDYTQTADSLDYHDSAKGMLAERLSRSRSRSLGRDLESPNSHVVGAEKVSVSPSGSATSSSSSPLSSLPSSSRSSPILIDSDSPQKVDPPKDNRSNRSSPIELSPINDDDRLNKPSRATAKVPPVPTWKTGEEKRGGKRPVTFKKASYGVNGKGGKSTVPYAKELMESHRMPFPKPTRRIILTEMQPHSS